MARNGHVNIGLAASPDLSSVALTRASGTLDGDGLQVHWLRPIPPIENGQAQLRIVDPDTMDIIVDRRAAAHANRKASSRRRPADSRRRMRITGIMQRDQIGTIDADIAVRCRTPSRCCASRGWGCSIVIRSS